MPESFTAPPSRSTEIAETFAQEVNSQYAGLDFRAACNHRRPGSGACRNRRKFSLAAKFVATSPLPNRARDRKSTRLNSSHGYISYAVFCLKKKQQYALLVFVRDGARP